MADLSLFALGLILLVLWIAIMLVNLCQAWSPSSFRRYCRRLRFSCCCCCMRESESAAVALNEMSVAKGQVRRRSRFPSWNTDSTTSTSSMTTVNETSGNEAAFRRASKTNYTLFTVGMKNLLTQVVITTVLPVCHVHQSAMCGKMLADAAARFEGIERNEDTNKPMAGPGTSTKEDPTDGVDQIQVKGKPVT